MKNKQKCSICGEIFEGFGNNAWPINDGTCCDYCNMTKVVPARMIKMYSTDKENKNEEV